MGGSGAAGRLGSGWGAIGRSALVAFRLADWPPGRALADLPRCPAAPSPGRTAHFTYSLNPSRPPSRPKPLSRYPPKPLAASNTLVQLIQTVPALSCGATSNARLMFSLQTLAARPYRVLLASSTASAGVRKVMSTTTGPKISTCAMVAAGATSVKSVGGKNTASPRTAPAGLPQLGPLLLPPPDQILNLLQLNRCDDRAHVDGLVQRV